MNANDVRDWAIQNDLHQSVLSFVARFGAIGNVDGSDDILLPYTQTEGWKAVTSVLRSGQYSSARTLAPALVEVLGGTGAIQFAKFFEYGLFKQNTDDIIRGNPVPIVGAPEKLAYHADVLVSEILDSLETALDDAKRRGGSAWEAMHPYAEWQGWAENGLRYCMSNLPPEYVGLFFRGVVTLAPGLTGRRAFTQAMARYRDILDLGSDELALLDRADHRQPLRIVIEGDCPDIYPDDGGQAVLFEMEADEAESGIAVQVRSWSEDKQHKLIERFAHRRIRITVETLAD